MTETDVGHTCWVTLTSPNPRPNIGMYEWKEHNSPPKEAGVTHKRRWKNSIPKARIYYPADKSKMAPIQTLLERDAGQCHGDIYGLTFTPINSQAKERLGYPTQKPVALLERIIKASSNPGDLVLDPFCGCGTTIDAAEKLGREWIGIDITQLAISLIKNRLRDTYGAG